MSTETDEGPIYANGPGHLERDGHVSHKRRANASASVKAPLLGRSRTTLGAVNGPATADMNLAQAEGLSVLTNAAINTSAGVASGTPCIVASPTDYVDREHQASVLTKSSHGCASFTVLLRRWLKAGKPVNWPRIGGLLALASPWLMAALVAHLLGAF